MDSNQRLQLQNMIKANNVEDQTSLIRNLKHSQIIRDEVNTMIVLKAKYKGNDEKIHEETMNECPFIFTYYTDIYNKVRKDEIDIGLLNKFLDVLKQIENGELDQHEGSFLIGNILKEIYIDSALKKADKLNTPENAPKPVPIKQALTYAEFKKIQQKDKQRQKKKDKRKCN
jgi:hypothetical protein